ncbi:MAG: hypothetical protein PHO44_00875 [Sphaerochaetaceae bacterium]|jgi:hypothetical protein|nr:hypothetical protein [Sphaerochaetaceae bacterium]MDD3162590.1 hypothetical protein [Sphaerochaetaceae bacterium]MDD4006509.1 hypothetical protein [Sphaerochaetaceae bacterium]MDD4395954.1 hypothetical protein [Sphaerochaetaceae bacterium]
MKKFAVVLIIACILCSCAYAADDGNSNQSWNWFDLSAGFNFTFRDGALSSLSDIKNITAKDINFGVELRTKMLFLELDASGELGVTESNGLQFSGLLVAGISEDLFGTARLGICLGPVVDYVHDGKKGTLVIDGNSIEAASFTDALNKSHFNIRTTLDFFLGPVIKLGVSFTLPTDFTLETHDMNMLIPNSDNLKEGSFSLVLQMTLV